MCLSVTLHTIPLLKYEIYEIVLLYKYEIARGTFSRVLLTRILPVRKKNLSV